MEPINKEADASGLLDRFGQWKSGIEKTLRASADPLSLDFSRVHPLGPEVLERITEFSVGGKMIRGGLVCLACGLASGEVKPEAYTAAAAVELFQSALLIHDDIMDRDPFRRGQPSVYHRYTEESRNSGIADADHIGEGLGICAGDIAFFLGFETIAKAGPRSDLLVPLFARCGRELSYVGIAQMADLLRGAADETVPEEAVLNLYRYKTARYTFSLPLALGAVLGGLPNEQVHVLENLGEDLGILFQLKDDEIGLFGDEKVTGKPVGSDIREGKKTLFYYYLFESASQEDRERLSSVFGSQKSTTADVEYVLELIESSGARSRVAEMTSEFAESAGRSIDTLTGAYPEYLALLRELVAYNMSRTR